MNQKEEAEISPTRQNVKAVWYLVSRSAIWLARTVRECISQDIAPHHESQSEESERRVRRVGPLTSVRVNVSAAWHGER